MLLDAGVALGEWEEISMGSKSFVRVIFPALLSLAACGSQVTEESVSLQRARVSYVSQCFVPTAQGQPCPVLGTRTGFVLPGNLSAEDVTLGTTSLLEVGAGAHVEGASVNAGAWQTSIGSAAITGDISSEAFTLLGSSVQVNGDVRSHSSISEGPGVHVSGSRVANTALRPTEPVAWLALFPVANHGAVNVAANGSLELAPGNYGALALASGATLTLRGGTYSFDSLTAASGSAIVVAATDTPLIAHVRSGFTLNGKVTRSATATQGALFTYLGDSAISLTQPFRATLAAPFSALTLAATAVPYRGAFFASSITLGAGVVVQHESFGSWDDLPTIEGERRGPLPTIQTRVSNGPPPVLDSTPQAAQRFIDWLVNSSKGDLPAARSALHQAPDKVALTANLAQQFSAIRRTDATRATLILNAIGSLATPAAEVFFTSLLNEPLPAASGISLDAVQKVRLLERYQAAAVHGLAFLHSSTADTLLKSVMRNHASAQIRAEAVRTFLFQNPDTNRAELAALLSPNEGALVDRFENRSIDGSSSFDERLAAYLAKHPQL